MAGQNIKGRGQRPNSLEGGGARYLKSYTTCVISMDIWPRDLSLLVGHRAPADDDRFYNRVSSITVFFKDG